MTTDETIALFDQYVIPNYTRNRVVIVRGEGAYVWDADGKRYLDLFPGWAVNGLGHCHPRVTEAIREQAGKLLHVPNTYYNELQGQLAKWLSEKSFGGQCFFCNSGAEAIEAAIKLARLHTQGEKYELITMANSFHGRTFGAITATGQPKYHKGLGPLLPGFQYVPFNDLEAVKDAFTDQTCAVLLEPIQGEGGINVADESYLRELRALCDERGALLIFDEVQTGMGRTGEYFAYQLYDVKPDIMALAKALGGGVAIGAIVAEKAVAGSLKPGTHASTFGGNPLACSAAIAVFEAIENDGLLAHARELGEHAMGQLKELAERTALIKNVRGKGLMIGVELTKPGADVVKDCMDSGLLINCTHDTVIRFMPPMIATKEHIDEGVSIFAAALERAS